MAQLVVRNLDVDIKAALKRRAVEHGWSMEEEIRQILRLAVSEYGVASGQLGSRIAGRFTGNGLEGPMPEWRGEVAEPMAFEGEARNTDGNHQ